MQSAKFQNDVDAIRRGAPQKVFDLILFETGSQTVITQGDPTTAKTIVLPSPVQGFSVVSRAYDEAGNLHVSDGHAVIAIRINGAGPWMNVVAGSEGENEDSYFGFTGINALIEKIDYFVAWQPNTGGIKEIVAISHNGASVAGELPGLPMAGSYEGPYD